MILIGELAKQTGVAIGTIRFYEQKGVLPKAQRNASGNRVYDDEALHWLLFVSYLRQTGMSVSQLRTYRELIDAGPETVPQRIKILKKQRQAALDQITAAQEQVTQIDHKISNYKAGYADYL